MNFSTSDAILITKQEAARILGIHHTTLRSLRNKENSGIIEGLHWVKWNSRAIRYNRILIENYALHRGNLIEHERFVEQYVKQLSTNSRRRDSKVI
ncbi:MAG: hypothetical protein KME45_32945 [Stenomitos rutilans HA7619-LM2]|jgi:hypothetical protein|nr:hypothetical protein [Stenomitos rutilans HA7619-LM2]